MTRKITRGTKKASKPKVSKEVKEVKTPEVSEERPEKKAKDAELVQKSVSTRGKKAKKEEDSVDPEIVERLKELIGSNHEGSKVLTASLKVMNGKQYADISLSNRTTTLIKL